MVLRSGLESEPRTYYKTSNHIITYLYIFGAKQFIYNDNDFDFINHLNMLMEDAIEESGGVTFHLVRKVYASNANLNKDIFKNRNKFLNF